MRVKQILLYGVPGTGKSTLGALIAGDTSIPFYELDLLRHDLPPEGKEPFLHIPSTLAWQSLGPLNSTTAVDGFMRVRQALRPYVAQKLKNLGTDFIAESVFIDPLVHPGITALVMIKSVELHYSHFFVHRQSSKEADQQFEAARFIQAELVKEALKLEIPTIDNDSAPERALEILFEKLDLSS
jgi:2-phosphoglycerate kinase